MPRKAIRVLIFSLWLLVAASAIGCMVLPVMGANSFFSEFKVPYSKSMHFQILADQLVGPAFTLLFSSALMVLLGRKRLKWWLWFVALVGPLYTVRAASIVAHDFSHTVFDECGGVYGIWLGWICALSGGLLAAIALLACFDQRRLLRDKLPEQASSSDG